MAPSSSPASFPVDRHEEVCREIFKNQNRPGLLVRALARRSLDERRGIKESYRALYGEEFVDLLLNVKEDNQENESVYFGLWMWMMEPPERDAVVAKGAVDRGGGDDYKALFEIYVCRKSNHLFFIRQAYLVKFRRHLDSDILFVNPEHPGTKILAAISTSHRSHHEEVSKHIANCDAKKLHEALKSGGGGINDSAIVIEIFSKRSISQLRLAFSSYKHIYGHDYTEAFGMRSGEFEDSLKVVIQLMCTPYTYYSELIHSSLMAESTKKTTLTRAIIGSVEAGMNNVKNTYEKKYNVKLEDDIVQRVHGDENYKDFLLALTNVLGWD